MNAPHLPTPPTPQQTVVLSADNVPIDHGSRAYNYYDRQPGHIVTGTIDRDGWFTFQHDDGTLSVLNGERICSLEFAHGKGWFDPH